jgi:general secretion pathway protein G
MVPVPMNRQQRSPRPPQAPRRPARRRSHRGLTLIEILIVIAILLALMALVVVNVMPTRERANVDLTRVQIGNIASALDQFKLDIGRYPTEEEGIRALWNRDALDDEREQQNWREGGYIDPIRADPWGNEYIYRYPGEIRGERYFDLISLGPDGEEGTEDDITNHDHLRDEEGEIEQFDDFGFN